MPSRRTCTECNDMCSLRYESYVTISQNPKYGEDGAPDLHVHDRCLPDDAAKYIARLRKRQAAGRR